MTIPPRGRPRTRRVTLALAGLVAAIISIGVPSHADEPGYYSPSAGDELSRSYLAYQDGRGGAFNIDGFVMELGPPPLIFPLVSHYTAHHRAYGDWYCYGQCVSSPSTYVVLKRDSGAIFIDDTWWMGQKVVYNIGFEVTWRDNPQKMYTTFVGPSLQPRVYQQGVTDAHPLPDHRFCEPFIYGPNETRYCASGGGFIGGYYHAPLFHNETSVFGADDMSYFATGSGSFDWGWDGIN